MRSFKVKLWGSIVLLAGFAIVLGCGSGTDLLDDIGYRYRISSANPSDRGAETKDIDVWHDCDNDLSNGDDGEDSLTAATVTLAFKSNTDEADIFVYQIQTDFTLSKYSGPVAPPELPSNTSSVNIFVPGNGGSSDPQEIDLLSPADKLAYTDTITDAGLTTQAVFHVKVTAFLTYTPGSADNTLEISRSFDINVGNFQHSSCTADEEAATP